MQNITWLYYTNNKETLIEQDVKRILSQPVTGLIDCDFFPNGDIYMFIIAYLRNKSHTNEDKLKEMMQEYGVFETFDTPAGIRKLTGVLSAFLEDSKAMDTMERAIRNYFSRNKDVATYMENDMRHCGTEKMLKDGFISRRGEKEDYLIFNMTGYKKNSAIGFDVIGVGDIDDVINAICFLNYPQLRIGYEITVEQDKSASSWLTATFNSSPLTGEEPNVYRFIPYKWLALALIDKDNRKIYANTERICRLDLLQPLINGQCADLVKEMYQ